ncbi:MAG: hypothetical protein AAF441_17160 [Pseudomonadota bacterium]
MQIFNASTSFQVPGGEIALTSVERAVASFLEFHNAQAAGPENGVFTFEIPTFVLSSRNKPLHRFQSGRIIVQESAQGGAEIAFTARLSKPNIFGCVASVVLGLLLSIGMLLSGETSIWWSLGAAAAGLLIAFTAKDQCVTRLRNALLEAAALARKEP